MDTLHATAALELLDCFPQSLRFYRDPWHNLCPNNYAQTHACKNASITSRHIARAGSCQEDMSAYTLVLLFIAFLCLASTRLYSLAQARLALQVLAVEVRFQRLQFQSIWVILPVLHGKKRMLLPIDSSQLPGLLEQHFLAQDCCNLGQTKSPSSMASGHWWLMWLMWLLITTASTFEQKSHALQDLALSHSVIVSKSLSPFHLELPRPAR